MRINEENIVRVVCLLVDEIIADMYTVMSGSVDDDHRRIEMLGEIKGISLLAKTLNKVLRS